MLSGQTLAAQPLPLQEAYAEGRFGVRPLEIRLAFSAKSSEWLFALQQGMKRALDILLALVGIFALLPVFLVIGLLVKLTSPGPILYKSLRIGKHYRPFLMYKFRTMAINADALREELRKKANLQGNLFKLPDDPRVTRIGRFLRALSLDELPQLFNVVQGNMSLVGPRPLPPDESELFEEPYTIRYQVSPGITGIWQVSGRSQLDFGRLCKLELTYVLGWSLWEDVKILLKTVPVVLLKKGAC